MKEEKVIKSLKITSIVFGLILGILSIFLVLNESFALFASKTDKVTYSMETHKEPILTTGNSLYWTLRDAGYKNKITKVIFEVNKDLDAITSLNTVYDVSDRLDGGILAYVSEDTTAEGKYILHIATNDSKIYANPNCSELFRGDNYGFNNLSEIEGMSFFDTSKVTDMSYMFGGTSIVNIDVSHFDTSKVTNMGYMFCNCTHLISLDLSHFDTSNVTSMNSMFCECENLTSLDVSHFDTNSVTDMYGMFMDYHALTSLDLSSFDMVNVSTVTYMFYGCSNLTTIYVKTTADADRIRTQTSRINVVVNS